MSRKARYSLGGILTLILVAGIAALSILSCSHKSEECCTGMQVTMKDSLQFITADDVKKYIEKEYGALVGQRADSVKLYRIEEIMKSRSTVKACEAWMSSDGILHLDISQRAPSVLFKKGNAKFYSDNKGFIFPTGGKMVQDIPVIEGDIPLTADGDFKGELSDPKEKAWVAGVIGFVDKMNASRDWNGRVTSFRVKNGDLVLKVKDGDEQFIFGDPWNTDSKLARIDKYYNKILPVTGRGVYKTVNVKFNSQIICRKDI